MKKYLFIFLGLAIAASASAGIPIKKRGDHLGLSQSHELKMSSLDSRFPEYEATGLGSIWTDDNQFGGFLQGETVLTEFFPPTMPTNVTATPDVTSADVTWDGGDGDNWNLRWRPWTDLSGNPHFWDFALDTYQSQLEGWWYDDADHDGNGWGLAYSNDDLDDVCLYSFSWTQSTGELDPDNYIGTPDVPLKGVLRFKAWSPHEDFIDKFQVYAKIGNEMYQLFDDDLSTTIDPTPYEVDLSPFLGAEGSIVFRHYNSPDQYGVYIDDVFVGDPNAEIIEPAEWVYANDLDDTEYTIEELTPHTKYEVQAQAVFGEKKTEWTDIVTFMTLYVLDLLNDDSAPGVGKNSLRLVLAVGTKANAVLTGRTFFKDGKWNTLCLPFRVSAEQLADESDPLYGATIKKFHSGNVTGNHVDIVFSDAETIEKGECYIFKWENVGEDIIDPVFKNVEIEDCDPYITESLDNGHFQIFGNYDAFAIDPAQDGCYTYYLTSAGDLKYSDKPRTLKTFRIFFRFFADNADAGALDFNLDFGDGNQTGIVELDGNGRDAPAHEGYYNLQGLKYNGQPLQKGIYINNGHKVVVK